MLKKEIIFKLAFTVINLDKVAALAALRHASDLRTKQVKVKAYRNGKHKKSSVNYYILVVFLVTILGRQH